MKVTYQQVSIVILRFACAIGVNLQEKCRCEDAVTCDRALMWSKMRYSASQYTPIRGYT